MAAPPEERLSRVGAVLLPDPETVADLTRFVGRAARIDAEGAVRLVVHGSVLAIYACAVTGGGGPTVLGLRTMALAEDGEGDVTTPLRGLTDRLARMGPLERRLDLPVATATRASWAGVVPPRSGWSIEGVVEADDLRRSAAEGIAEVAAGTPPGAGAAAVARLRAQVWSRELVAGSQVPSGAAFAADAFGFLDAEPVSVHRNGPWWRLSLLRGHVLARRPSLG